MHKRKIKLHTTTFNIVNNNNKYSCKQQNGAKPWKAPQVEQIHQSTSTASTASKASTAEQQVL